MKSKFNFSTYKLTEPQLLLLIAVIILVAPYLFTFGAIWGHWDFSKTGQIGDTIGGITAPFMSAVATVVVFAAFKVQVKANQMFKQQQNIQSIESLISKLEDRSIELHIQKKKIQESLRESSNIKGNWDSITNKQIRFTIDQQSGLEVLYSSIMFVICNEMLENLDSEKGLLFKRLGLLYSIKYSNTFSELYEWIHGKQNIESNDPGLVDDLLKHFQKLDALFFGLSKS